MGERDSSITNASEESVIQEAGYLVKLDAFEGPLDLLLHLIEKRKLHISDISLGKITDDYLSYIGGLKEFPLREAAHFILVAATLLLIKSRSLLPTLELTEDEESDIEALERRLKIYKRVKELSEIIREKFGTYVIFYREPPKTISPVFTPTHELTIPLMWDAMKRILKALPKKEMIPQLVLKKVVSIDEMIESLIERISQSMNVSFKEFTGSSAEKTKIIVSFLAMLELVKRGLISVTQNEHFEDIMIGSNK